MSEALEAMHVADELRSQPEGTWIESHWLAIASDGAGQHLVIDDQDGRVLSVAHDDDHVQVVAPSVEAWLEQLLEGHAHQKIVWDPVFGLIDVVRLQAIHEAKRVQARPRVSPPPSLRTRMVFFGLVTFFLVAATMLVTRR